MAIIVFRLGGRGKSRSQLLATETNVYPFGIADVPHCGLLLVSTDRLPSVKMFFRVGELKNVFAPELTCLKTVYFRFHSHENTQQLLFSIWGKRYSVFL